MGQNISHDLITLVQVYVHHYETRCALRLTCKKFERYIPPFDSRAFPIFSTESYMGKHNDGGVRWKGNYTYSAKSQGGVGYLRLCLRPYLHYYHCLQKKLHSVKKSVFQASASKCYWRFFSTLHGNKVRTKYCDDNSCILKKILKKLSRGSHAPWGYYHCYHSVSSPSRSYSDDRHSYNLPDFNPDVTRFDLMRIHITKVNSQKEDKPYTESVYIKFTEYREMMRELEDIMRMRNEFFVIPGISDGVEYSEQAYQKAQQDKIKIIKKRQRV